MKVYYALPGVRVGHPNGLRVPAVVIGIASERRVTIRLESGVHRNVGPGALEARR